MTELFNNNFTVSLCAGENEELCVLKALLDLQKDLRRISGNSDGFSILNKQMDSCIYVLTAGESSFCGIKAPQKAEGFTVSIHEGNVFILGYDSLGTVFGIYAFCDRILGVDPGYLFSEDFPEQKAELRVNDIEFSDWPKGPRFRGWFLNDEDLLSDFRPDGGKRYIDYKFYGNVTNPSVLEIILETALRLGLNLIIPASFINIDNPDEARLVKAVYERGLYITQHHVEPMGVSYFSADDYMKRFYGGAKVSFVTNRAQMEEIWRYYAKKWAVYGDKVIWQLGLRGKADVPVWSSDDSVPVSPKDRGALLTDAVDTQCRILREVLGNDKFLSTFTIWMESAELYSKGFLQIPEGVIVVFCDIGFNQMLSNDFFTVPRYKNAHYGIYYHTAYWSAGPHMHEGCSPEKMVYSYIEVQKKNPVYYYILNVSNVREFNLSIRVNAALLWDPESFDLDAFIGKVFKRLYGDCADKVQEGYQMYYRAFADLGLEELKEHCRERNFHYHEYGELPFINNSANDGRLRYYGRTALLKGNLEGLKYLDEIKASEKRFAELSEYWKRISVQIPENFRKRFAVFPVLQTEYLLYLTRWCIGCLTAAKAKENGNAELAKNEAEKAALELEKLLLARKIAEEGEWTGWYKGDKKMDINALLELTRTWF